MKFGNTGRDITDKNKFMGKKKTSPFLERFKGRTIQMSREGHIGIVKSTGTPIKPIHPKASNNYGDQHHPTMKSISKPMYVEKSPKRKSGPLSIGFFQIHDKFMHIESSIESFNPGQRSNSIPTHSTDENTNRYSAFAKNYQKVEDVFSKNKHEGRTKRSLANAGGQIMSGSAKSLNGYPKMHSSRSMAPENSFNSSGLSYQKAHHGPSSSKENPTPYNDMGKRKIHMGNKNRENSYKTSFYSAGGPTKPYKMKGMPSDKSNSGMPYSTTSFNGANSDGFTHTSVSTPLYKKGKSYKTPKAGSYGNQKEKMDAQLTILRRSIQNGKQGFKDFRYLLIFLLF